MIWTLTDADKIRWKKNEESSECTHGIVFRPYSHTDTNKKPMDCNNPIIKLFMKDSSNQ